MLDGANQSLLGFMRDTSVNQLPRPIPDPLRRGFEANPTATQPAAPVRLARDIPPVIHGAGWSYGASIGRLSRRGRSTGRLSGNTVGRSPVDQRCLAAAKIDHAALTLIRW